MIDCRRIIVDFIRSTGNVWIHEINSDCLITSYRLTAATAGHTDPVSCRIHFDTVVPCRCNQDTWEIFTRKIFIIDIVGISTVEIPATL